MNEERERLRKMIYLVQNAENAKREHIITEHLYKTQGLSPNTNAKDKIDELLDQNNFSEYQKAFHQFNDALEKNNAYFIRLEKVKIQSSKTKTILSHFLTSQP